MLCKEIIEIIERTYPKSSAMEWDNVGLLAGRADKEVGHIYVALDATDEAVDDAASLGADLLVTHHPLIFSGLKQVTNENFTGARVLELARRDISCYAMHTNYDIKRMAQLSCEKLGMERAETLEVTNICADGTAEGIGKIADISPVPLEELCMWVKGAFGLDAVRVFGNPGTLVKRVAICPGSGKSVIGTAVEKGADVLITGDIGHHEGIDALAEGMAVIDAGHYGIEHIFIEDMEAFLKENIPHVRVSAAAVRHPFITI